MVGETLRIGVVSDIHSNLEALNEVMKELKDCQKVLCAGDLVGYGPDPNEVIELLSRETEKGRFHAVMGNHDYAVVTGDTHGFSHLAREGVRWTRSVMKKEETVFLRSLKKNLKISIGGITFSVFHGSPRNPLDEYVFPQTPQEILERFLKESGGKVLILGHTHVPMIRELKEGLVINPGSVGQPRDFDPRASFIVLEIKEGELEVNFRRVEYDVESTMEKISERGLPRELGERLLYGL